MFYKLNSLSQKVLGFAILTTLNAGVLFAEAVTSSQNLSITILTTSSLTFESPSLEVIFDASEGIIQERVLTTGYHVNNIGTGRNITGAVDHLPPGITIAAEMAVPEASFGGDVLPVSSGSVELTTTHNQVLSQINKIVGNGKVTYTVTCDLNLANVEQLQAHTVVVSYVMAAPVV
ncbi:hypothetical protein [Candidatus Similichlamydia laticola]|uniref:Uncharacterized protein n=1 Tax=Candidatus Similichlamydia laticola TaxID=2170265 RepID=A0A369KCS4_9BACT|nr:hypothetical protein [Candidatus Similichlamydia laticola]RDB31708.1 hypothetical protein HAT2_00217 [Candidatus Similichlamydia laticola]